MILTGWLSNSFPWTGTGDFSFQSFSTPFFPALDAWLIQLSTAGYWEVADQGGGWLSFSSVTTVDSANQTHVLTPSPPGIVVAQGVDGIQGRLLQADWDVELSNAAMTQLFNVFQA